MTTIYKILLAIGILGGVAFLAIHFAEASAATKVEAAEGKARDALLRVAELEGKLKAADEAAAALQTKADEWAAKAAASKAETATTHQQLLAAQTQLASMAPQPPVTNLTTIPEDPKLLAEAFKAAGFPAIVQLGSLGFAIPQARPMLAVVQDGLAYPNALLRIKGMDTELNLLVKENGQKDTTIDAMTQQVATQTEEIKTLHVSEDTCKEQVVTLQGAVVDEQKAVVAEKKVAAAEKRKGWLKAAAGVALGYALKVLLLSI